MKRTFTMASSLQGNMCVTILIVVSTMSVNFALKTPATSTNPTMAQATTSQQHDIQQRLGNIEGTLLEMSATLENLHQAVQNLDQVESLLVLLLQEMFNSALHQDHSTTQDYDGDESGDDISNTSNVDSAEVVDAEDEDGDGDGEVPTTSQQLRDALDGSSPGKMHWEGVLQALLERAMQQGQGRASSAQNLQLHTLDADDGQSHESPQETGSVEDLPKSAEVRETDLQDDKTDVDNDNMPSLRDDDIPDTPTSLTTDDDPLEPDGNPQSPGNEDTEEKDESERELLTADRDLALQDDNKDEVPETQTSTENDLDKEQPDGDHYDTTDDANQPEDVNPHDIMDDVNQPDDEQLDEDPSDITDDVNEPEDAQLDEDPNDITDDAQDADEDLLDITDDANEPEDTQPDEDLLDMTYDANQPNDEDPHDTRDDTNQSEDVQGADEDPDQETDLDKDLLDDDMANHDAHSKDRQDDMVMMTDDLMVSMETEMKYENVDDPDTNLDMTLDTDVDTDQTEADQDTDTADDILETKIDTVDEKADDKADADNDFDDHIQDNNDDLPENNDTNDDVADNDPNDHEPNELGDHTHNDHDSDHGTDPDDPEFIQSKKADATISHDIDLEEVNDTVISKDKDITDEKLSEGEIKDPTTSKEIRKYDVDKTSTEKGADGQLTVSINDDVDKTTDREQPDGPDVEISLPDDKLGDDGSKYSVHVQSVENTDTETEDETPSPDFTADANTDLNAAPTPQEGREGLATTDSIINFSGTADTLKPGGSDLSNTYSINNGSDRILSDVSQNAQTGNNGTDELVSISSVSQSSAPNDQETTSEVTTEETNHSATTANETKPSNANADEADQGNTTTDETDPNNATADETHPSTTTESVNYDIRGPYSTAAGRNTETANTNGKIIVPKPRLTKSEPHTTPDTVPQGQGHSQAADAGWANYWFSRFHQHAPPAAVSMRDNSGETRSHTSHSRYKRQAYNEILFQLLSNINQMRGTGVNDAALSTRLNALLRRLRQRQMRRRVQSQQRNVKSRNITPDHHVTPANDVDESEAPPHNEHQPATRPPVNDSSEMTKPSNHEMGTTDFAAEVHSSTSEAPIFNQGSVTSGVTINTETSTGTFSRGESQDSADTIQDYITNSGGYLTIPKRKAPKQSPNTANLKHRNPSSNGGMAKGSHLHNDKIQQQDPENSPKVPTKTASKISQDISNTQTLGNSPRGVNIIQSEGSNAQKQSSSSINARQRSHPNSMFLHEMDQDYDYLDSGESMEIIDPRMRSSTILRSMSIESIWANLLAKLGAGRFKRRAAKGFEPDINTLGQQDPSKSHPHRAVRSLHHFQSQNMHGRGPHTSAHSSDNGHNPASANGSNQNIFSAFFQSLFGFTNPGKGGNGEDPEGEEAAEEKNEERPNSNQAANPTQPPSGQGDLRNSLLSFWKFVMRLGREQVAPNTPPPPTSTTSNTSSTLTNTTTSAPPVEGASTNTAKTEHNGGSTISVASANGGTTTAPTSNAEPKL